MDNLLHQICRYLALAVYMDAIDMRWNDLGAVYMPFAKKTPTSRAPQSQKKKEVTQTVTIKTKQAYGWSGCS